MSAGRCLGTPITAADDDGRERTILLSDLHLTREGGPTLEWLERLLGRARDAAERTRVVVLGDLFDSYLKPVQLDDGGWRAAVDALRRTTASGVTVTVLHGNRDFLLGRDFERRSGCLVVPGGLSLRLAGRRALCLHGDELCLRDVGYQRLKRVLRSRPLRLAARLAPDRLAFRIGGRIRAASSEVQAGRELSRFDATAGAVDAAFAASGAELLVFGHVHRAAHHPRWRGAAGEVFVLPAFDEAGIHLEHGPDGLLPRDPSGSIVADFPARELS